QMILGRSLINAEVTLTNRDTMSFRMLLGRTAMDARFTVDPGASYLQGRPGTVEYQRLLTSKSV
ncbi:MAG: putative ATP-dependent zinc protease, partial [Methylobacter sp.]